MPPLITVYKNINNLFTKPYLNDKLLSKRILFETYIFIQNFNIISLLLLNNDQNVEAPVILPKQL